LRKGLTDYRLKGRRLMSKLVCTSPVDGTIYAERSLADDGAVAAAIARARAAQADWRVTPFAERARLCAAMTDAMAAMAVEMVPERA
ncbi:MAG: aldehyde dehydrogenase family protein, partial [Pseudomonadota bacterium]|nr:aldehyde dehydrogenase family protein [Pseudomonadota bacterium]